LVTAMDSDLPAGARHRVTALVASRYINILQTDLISPAEGPQHCPPALVWVQFLCDGRAQRIPLCHPERVADH
jgi:hypothetical protein